MQPTRLHLLAAGLLSGLVSAAPHARRGVECYFDVPAASGETCEGLASSWGISVDEFTKINPGVACPNLETGRSYCVVGDWTPDETTSSTQPPRTSITTSTTPVTTTTQPTTVKTSSTTTPATPSNSPTMPGAVSSCDKWYKIASGDTCDVVAGKNAITVDQFRRWNTQINSNCNNLLLGYYACVGAPGAATPMPGIVSGCNRYYQVVSGDSCDAIAQKSGITVANFRRWNTAINAGCGNLWADVLVCIGA